MSPNFLSDSEVCAIMVTYNPDIPELRKNINAVKDQVGFVYVVDNSTENSVKSKMKKILDAENLEIISNQNNYGIAYAQNQGIKKGIEKKYQAFLFLDQDSYIEKNTVSRLVDSHNKLYSQGKLVGLVGPVAFNKDKSIEDTYHVKRKLSHDYIEVKQTLSSGSLISKETLVAVGMMEEELFIDLVDYEWCWRAKKKGFSTYIIPEIKLAHRLGEGRKKLIGLEFGIPAPIRHYYQYRNTLQMMTRSYVPTEFKIKYVFLLPVKFVLYTSLISSRKYRLKMIIKGIQDGLKRKSGKIS